MFSQSFRRILTTIVAFLLPAATLVTAHGQETDLRIGRRTTAQTQYHRNTPILDIDRDRAFNRLNPIRPAIADPEKERRNGGVATQRASALERAHWAAAAPRLLSFGTGGGDVNEIEPNDLVAQGVSLPVNVFGAISVNRDADFFAFEALAGQQITIEPFAARLRNSLLAADIALFDASGRLLAADAGDENNDPLIRFVSARDQVLVVGIADVDDLGGSAFSYVLNITRGMDVDEQEPNDQSAQRLPDAPFTVFGEIRQLNDLDFYSFSAAAGQTLIVDVDAEVLGSFLDAEINLIDPETGIEFFYNDQQDGNDPRFNIVLPYAGRYVIGVGAFNSNSAGFYRLNASLVPATGAPLIANVTRLSKKLIEVSGAGFTGRSSVEVNSVVRSTTFVDSKTLRAKVKAKPGSVVSVSNSPDGRRSNPVLIQ